MAINDNASAGSEATSHNPTVRPVILVVGAEGEQALRIREIAEGSGAVVRAVPEWVCVGQVAEAGFTLALVVLGRKPMAGTPQLEVIRILHGTGRPVVVCGEHLSDWGIAARCLPLLAGAAHILDAGHQEFPAEFARVVSGLVERIANRAAQEREIWGTMKRLSIVAASTSMLDLLRTVMRFSLLSDLPALITGETGTGKERLARALHRLDPKRCSGPFVPVNCGALSTTLAESELFGHCRGSFTGAHRDRQGLVRSAEQGVLFLDEVGELPEVVQTKLLRVLQENRVLPVGAEREEVVDVRVVAATNRDLAERAAQGTFRPDLLHRLNVLPLQIPPLRERREDVRPLADHFLNLHSKAFGKPRPVLTDEVVEALEHLLLPGNVRELENIIRRALVNNTPPAPLRLNDLPPEVWSEVVSDAVSATAPPCAVSCPCSAAELEMEVRLPFDRLIALTDGRLDRSLAFCERVLISLALERTHGNQSETARLLHLTPRSIYNKLRRHQIRFPH